MKIRVQRRDGDIETIELLGDQMVAEANPTLTRLTGARMEHYFTADGYYDGWGMFAPPGAASLEAAAEVIREVEAGRVLDDCPHGHGPDCPLCVRRGA